MLEYYDIEQGSPEWFAVRAGIPTASEFATVMASGKGGGESKTRQTYLYKLAGEIITGEPAESYTNAHMERGKIMEAEARAAYEFMADRQTQPVGFAKRHDLNTGCSPDALVDNHGMIEIKTKLPHLQIAVLLADQIPPEHMAQVQGAMWITGREWCDFVSYWPRLPIFIKRAYRDEKYIGEIAGAVEKFNADLAELVGKIRGKM